MRIKEILTQHRRDFTAVYECEHCSNTYEGRGYDDSHYHLTVVPNMRCSKCGKRASLSYVPRAPRYPDEAII